VSFISEVFGNVVVVHTPEYLGDEQSRQLQEYITSRPQKNVVLDIDATEVIDSKGLSMLLDLHDGLRDRAGDLKISTSNHSNRKILEITRVDKHLDVFPTVLTAVKSYQ